MLSNLIGRLSLTKSCSVDLNKMKLSKDDYGKQAFKQSKERNGRDKLIDVVHGVEKYGHTPIWVNEDGVHKEVPILIQGMEIVDVPPPYSYAVVAIPYEKHLA